MELGPLQKLWILQLRSYPERQTKGQLGSYKNDKEYYACCLGELHLCYFRLKNKRPSFDSLYIEDGKSFGNLNKSYKKYGLLTPYGDFLRQICYKDKYYSCLAQLNDEGISWPEIADIIEKDPENVFNRSV